MNINLFTIYAQREEAIGFDILSFNNSDGIYSLLGITYDAFGVRLFIDFLYFQFVIDV